MLFHTLLVLATFLCSVVNGFLFAFAVVVMPGIERLDDRSFIRAFQVIDAVIQNNQPLFIAAWVGSALALIAAAAVGAPALAGGERLLLIGATVLYVLGVQVATIAVNIPLNNRLQRLDVDAADPAARTAARAAFEPKWNRWNVMRTAVASVVTLALIVLLVRV